MLTQGQTPALDRPLKPPGKELGPPFGARRPEGGLSFGMVSPPAILIAPRWKPGSMSPNVDSVLTRSILSNSPTNKMFHPPHRLRFDRPIVYGGCLNRRTAPTKNMATMKNNVRTMRTNRDTGCAGAGIRASASLRPRPIRTNLRQSEATRTKPSQKTDARRLLMDGKDRPRPSPPVPRRFPARPNQAKSSQTRPNQGFLGRQPKANF
jgi:hypothetical protein